MSVKHAGTHHSPNASTQFAAASYASSIRVGSFSGQASDLKRCPSAPSFVYLLVFVFAREKRTDRTTKKLPSRERIQYPTRGKENRLLKSAG